MTHAWAEAYHADEPLQPLGGSPSLRWLRPLEVIVVSRSRLLRSLVPAALLSTLLSLVASAVAFAGDSGAPFPK